MLVELDGRTYTVPEEYANKLIGQLWELAMAEYEKVPKAYRIGGMAIARKMLYDMETSITKSHGKEVALQIARPAKGADPNTHLTLDHDPGITRGGEECNFHNRLRGNNRFHYRFLNQHPASR